MRSSPSAPTSSNADTDAAKADFLATISHELRTPLTSIIGFSELLAESGSLADRDRRFADRVRQASHALLSLVNNILEFSRIEAGAIEIEPRPADPATVVEDAMAMMRPQADAKGLNLRLKPERGLDPAMIDAMRVQQVLINLIGNAVKFTEAGEVVVTLVQTADRLRFTVVDTGPGVPEARRGRLFQRYSQIDGTITRKHGGTGLGLAISHGLVQAMGGQIGFTPGDDGGSMFWFEIQAPKAPAAEQAA